MTELEQEYFEYLVNLINPDHAPYLKLLEQLYSTDYIIVKDDDNNRAEDGKNLRLDWLYEHNRKEDNDIWFAQFKACSVLEMMVALAIRMDENIMWNGFNRTSIWFSDMILSMGLEQYTDYNYDPESISTIVNAMMYYNIESNGQGGLFISPYNDTDMRDYSLWYQMQIYIQNKD